MALSPEQQQKLKEDREAMPADIRQAVALEAIADRLQLLNEKMTSLLVHAGTMTRRL